MKDIEELLNGYYEGVLSQDELACLFEAFLVDEVVRSGHAADAEVIVPLALARRDALGGDESFRHTTRRPGRTVGDEASSRLGDGKDAGKHPSRHWSRVAAAVLALLVASGVATAYAESRRPQVYSSDPSCDLACAEQWLNRTLETAL